jgi:hypothetical protein
MIPDKPYHPPEKLILYMRAKQDVWALVVRDGDTVLNRRLGVGDQRQWEAEYRYNITLGISTAVDLYVNDQKLAPLTERAQTISDLEINQVNYKDFYAPPLGEEESQPAEAITARKTTSTIPQTTPEAAMGNEIPESTVEDTTVLPGKDTADGD